MPLVATGLVLAATFLPAPGALGATQSPITIQPGDMIVIDDSAVCTLNFVFDGVGQLAGHVYIGTAAHCLAGNRNASIDHYAGDIAGQNGGYLLATSDAPRFAKVAYLGDYDDSLNGGAAVENGIPGKQLDFALLEVAPQYVPDVGAAVRGHPTMPTGYTTSDKTALGDVLLHSGHGIAYSDVQAARENHPGWLVSDNGRTYVEVGSSLPGDSGGPILHLGYGAALGIVSGTSYGLQVPPAQDYGPTVQGILAELSSLGVTVQLRTVS